MEAYRYGKYIATPPSLEELAPRNLPQLPDARLETLTSYTWEHIFSFFLFLGESRKMCLERSSHRTRA